MNNIIIALVFTVVFCVIRGVVNIIMLTANRLFKSSSCEVLTAQTILSGFVPDTLSVVLVGTILGGVFTWKLLKKYSHNNKYLLILWEFLSTPVSGWLKWVTYRLFIVIYGCIVILLIIFFALHDWCV